MASRLKSSKIREGAKALQPLALVALVGIVGTVTMLGGCGGGNNHNNQSTPTPFVPIPDSGTVGPTPTPTPSGGVTPTPTPTGGVTPTPTPTSTDSGSPTPTPTPTPTPNTLTLTQALSNIKADANVTVTTLALAPDNHWAIAFSTAGATDTDPTTYGYYLPPDAPPALKNALDGIIAASGRIKSITLGAGDVWLVTYNQGSDGYTEYQYNGIDASMLTRLINLRLNQNVNVTSAVIGSDPSVWALVVNQNGYYSQNLPAGLESILSTNSTNASITVKQIALGADSTYAVVSNNNQITGTATSLISAVNGAGATTINGIGLGMAGSYAAVYNKNQSVSSGVTRSR